MTAALKPPPLRIALLGVGSSPHVHRLAGNLAERGHAVAVLSEERHGPFPEVSGVTFRAYPHAVGLPARVAAIRGLLREFRPDVLNSHYVNIGGFMGVASGFHPHVMTAWGSDIYEAPLYSRAQYLKTAVALRAADWVLSPSNTLRLEMARMARGLRHNTIWQWGVDTVFFRPHDAAAARRKFGLPEGPLVYSPRALDPLYNQDKLIEAWPAVLREFPNARLIIKRLAPNLEFERSLRARAHTLGIAHSLIWEEPVPFAELPERYSAVDVIVSIPTSDGAPITMQEAMACGKPIVACDIAPLREWITPGVHGWLATPRDQEAIAAAILRALGQPQGERERLQQTVRSSVIERADKARHLDSLEQVFRDQSRQPGFSAFTTLMNVLR